MDLTSRWCEKCGSVFDVGQTRMDTKGNLNKISLDRHCGQETTAVPTFDPHGDDTTGREAWQVRADMLRSWIGGQR